MLGAVRAFTKEDIQQVADLHRRVFSTADYASPELWDSYQSYFTQIFLNDAWLDDDTRSLVYEEEGGRIVVIVYGGDMNIFCTPFNELGGLCV